VDTLASLAIPIFGWGTAGDFAASTKDAGEGRFLIWIAFTGDGD